MPLKVRRPNEMGGEREGSLDLADTSFFNIFLILKETFMNFGSATD